MSVSVFGAGAFGTALAISLAQNGPVTLWARDVSPLENKRQSPRLPGITLPDQISITGDLEQALENDTLLFSIPMQNLSGFLSRINSDLEGKALVACCKGVDLRSGLGPVGILSETKPKAQAAILTGPSFAADIAKGLPTALTLACTDDAIGKEIQHQLSTPSLRLYRSTDTVGAELGGALKNVMAIACGAAMGAGLGDSARAALMTRGFAEMTRFAASREARPETMAGLSGLGDLALTCTSDLSRNYQLGLALGRKEAFDPSITVEGAATAQAMDRIAIDTGLSLPICHAVAALTQGRVTVDDVMTQLLSRPLKEE
ncbi:Glycerol-3-phosphate dehydrogenase [NAD(P)+] [Pelagimonas phthalicica]|uniref:Glycerol-3-phosphate dehydrogenase [NAD(P)+] n=1 Tax=Pelagimonas phthalicica TaxID=1037362 RepID=A0A238J7B9_9RHOB|nr:NAD(P)H-dependent glycerol-3-phosphate dehydrogenase [Pelagimonas phthalicica]TDS95233.1 glycerol-3-phosphate dehydrogenase (NAD(P)+) [Pelagimonas phthalicica]SMX26243.1 Glycerol-3-phosphate dehydrogenase [NAD(P)+] [Pelagimonas phthalicica]